MLNFAIYLLEVFSTILIVHIVFQSRFKLDFSVIALLAISVGMLFLAFVTNIQIITYVAQFAIYIYCLCKFHRSWWESLLRFACSIAIGAIIETMFLMEVNSWLQTSKHSLYVYLGINSGMFLCSVILYWFFVYKQISFRIDMADKTFIVLVIIINVFVLYVKEDGHGRYLRLIICIISFVLLIARFTLITKKETKRRMTEESEWLEQYTEQYDELIQEVRRRQHDYKNELQTIKTVYAVGEST
ncbi:MAG: hypothetical protein ACI4L2_03790, partial [Wujia sp.]